MWWERLKCVGTVVVRLISDVRERLDSIRERQRGMAPSSVLQSQNIFDYLHMSDFTLATLCALMRIRMRTYEVECV